MANRDSTLISRAVRKGRAGRGPKREKSTSVYSSVSTDDMKLAAPPSVEEPRQLAFWRQRDPRRARQRILHALYVRDGNVFLRASSTQILEWRQASHCAALPPGPSRAEISRARSRVPAVPNGASDSRSLCGAVARPTASAHQIPGTLSRHDRHHQRLPA